MRLIILIIGLILAYLALSGDLPLPTSGSNELISTSLLALIVLSAATALTTPRHSSRDSKPFYSKRKTRILDYAYILTVIISVQLLLLCIIQLGPKTALHASQQTHQWVAKQFGKELTFSDQPPSASTTSADSAAASGKTQQIVTKNASNWLWDNDQRRQLPKETNIRLGKRPQLYLVLDKPSQVETLKQHQIYVSQFSLHSYHKGAWKNDIVSKIRFAGPLIHLSSPSARLKQFPQYTYRIFQPSYRQGQNILTTLQHPLSVHFPHLLSTSPGTYHLAHSPRSINGYRYRATSQPLDTEHLFEQVSDIPHPREAQQDNSLPRRRSYLEPLNQATLRQRLIALLRADIHALPLRDQLRAIKTTLQSNTTYSLSISNPQQLDPLENFLFGMRQGYCEFYATAAALLCRELGIPSRITYGWTGGSHFPGSTTFLFTAEQAHAWTEIHLPNIGWVVFDTTPKSATPTTATNTNTVPDLNKVFSPPPPSPKNSLFTLAENLGWKLPMAILTLGTLLTLGLLFLRNKTTTLFVEPGRSKHSPAYLQRYRELANLLELPLESGTTLRQHIQTMRDHGHASPLLEGLLEDLLDYHYGITYCQKKPSTETERQLAAALHTRIKELKHT